MAARAVMGERTAAIAAVVGERFPLYAAADGSWVSSQRASWAGGWWAGLLWLRARQDPRATGLAQRRTAGLARWQLADTAVRGMIFWYGAVIAARIGPLGIPVPSAASSADPPGAAGRAAARALAASYHPDSGVIPWGNAFGDKGLQTRVDGLPGTVPLLAWAGEKEVAAAYLRTHLRLGPGAAWAWEGGKWRPLSVPAADWTRGQAWLLLAAADGSQWLGSEFSEPAHDLARQWLAQYATAAPPAHASAPGGLVDSSAAAIAAVALLKLGYAEGATIIERLVAEHMIGGRLLHGCLDASSGTGTAHELIWGNFFLALGLELLENPARGRADM